MAKLQPLMRVACCLGSAIALAAAPAAAQQPKDILYYGNSFTLAVGFGSTRSVPVVLASITTAAGHPAPRNRNASSAGQPLQWHLTNNTAVIANGVTLGERWDYVVLQDFSTHPTHIGNLTQHLSSSKALYERVAMHSPQVVPIMFETWARAPGHEYYTAPVIEFPGGPAQMQQEVRDGYIASTAGINASVGSALARMAPVGDAWEDAGFPINYYASDRYHASNRGTLLTALVLYGTIYDDPTTADIDLSELATQLNLPPADVVQIQSFADGVLVPEPCMAVTATLALVVIGRRIRRGAAANCRPVDASERLRSRRRGDVLPKVAPP